MDEALLRHDPADVRRRVEARFSVYDVQHDGHVLIFYVDVESDTVEGEFDALKDELKRENLIPVLKYQGGEHAIYVLEKPERRFRSVKVNLALFILTWVTTTLAGTIAWAFYANPQLIEPAWQSTHFENEIWPIVFAPQNFLFGFLTFALPLMAILGVHEMGHYYMTKKHGMEASLPFFIPLPPFIAGVEIGTLGAFISMREPIPNKKALFDIGVSGPIAGLVVAVPVLLLGMFFMQVQPVSLSEDALSETLNLGTPLLYQLLEMPFGIGDNQLTHPTAFAGWVGLFVTAINLFPAGQLDGGHIASALFGDRARYFSYAVVAVLTTLGLFGLPWLGIQPYGGWLVFALLIAFLGVNHPPTLDGVTGLDGRRQFVGALAFGLILLCFTPVPIATM